MSISTDLKNQIQDIILSPTEIKVLKIFLFLTSFRIF